MKFWNKTKTVSRVWKEYRWTMWMFFLTGVVVATLKAEDPWHNWLFVGISLLGAGVAWWSDKKNFAAWMLENYVEGAKALLDEVDHLHFEYRVQIKALEQKLKIAEENHQEELDRWRGMVVWGFYEEKEPIFTQGKAGEHELADPVTEGQIRFMVKRMDLLERMGTVITELRDRCREWAKGVGHPNNQTNDYLVHRVNTVIDEWARMKK